MADETGRKMVRPPWMRPDECAAECAARIFGPLTKVARVFDRSDVADDAVERMTATFGLELARPDSELRVAFELGRRWELLETTRRLVAVRAAIHGVTNG